MVREHCTFPSPNPNKAEYLQIVFDAAVENGGTTLNNSLYKDPIVPIILLEFF